MKYSSFERCLVAVLQHEGGDKITEDPRDPGGLTKYGISQRSFPAVDIRNLTREQASEIYRQHYWNRVRGDVLPVGLALCVFDCAVNQGSGTAAKLLQQAVGATQDGVLGPQTMAAIQARPELMVIERLQTLRSARYLGMNNGTEEAYERGWIARLLSVACTATAWACECKHRAHIDHANTGNWHGDSDA